MRVNGDVFISKYKGIQVSALVTIAPGTSVPSAVNGPDATIKGAELELIGQFNAFAFNLGASMLSAGTTASQVLTNSSVSPSVEAVVPDGSLLPFSPKMTASAGLEYTLTFGDVKLTPRLQAAYLGEQYATFFKNDRLTKVPSRTVVDFRLTLNPNEQLTLEGFATNLLDKTYIAVQVQEASSAAGGYIYGAPRQIGLRAKYSY
jgi:iron complex outermembrane receptor protein